LTGTADLPRVPKQSKVGAWRAMPLLFAMTLLLFTTMFLVGCTPQTAVSPPIPMGTSQSSVEKLAPGVVHRAIPTGPDAGIDIVDVNLAQSAFRPAIVTGKIMQGMGPALTPEDWLTRGHALAAANGGYFGAEDTAGNKEFIGLLVRKGKIIRSASPLLGQGSSTLAAGRYVRSAFGVTRAGAPVITWAATTPRLVRYDSPLIAHQRSRPWVIWDAVGCGPTLIQNSKLVVTDRRERLASPGPRPRTFVAYGGPVGHPTHFILGIASAMTFAELAKFLHDYFLRYDSIHARAAMCLDGGESTQLSYRQGQTIQSPRDTGVTVPDAIVIRSP
jgi:hypothetical protein